MKRNPLAILFSVIALPEPAIEDDDTALFVPVADEPPVMHTHPITQTALLSNDQLIGNLVAYRLDKASNWQLGNIRAVEETRFGMKVLFTPKNTDLCEKWRFLNEVVYAWFE